MLCTNLCCSFSAQAKLTKRVKKTKSAGVPDLPEPAVTVEEPPAASSLEATTPMDTAPEATAPTTKATTEASVNPEASGSAPLADDPDVVITRTEYIEPGRPTVLVKCSAKGELLQPHQANLDLSNYSKIGRAHV